MGFLNSFGVCHRLLITFIITFGISVYLYYVVRPLSSFLIRLSFCFPVFFIYIVLPWIFDPSDFVLFTGIYYWALTWLASFKILSFCSGSGPLSYPWISNNFFRFWITLNCPILIRPYHDSKHSSKTNSLISGRKKIFPMLQFFKDQEGYPMLTLQCIFKGILMGLLIKLYAFKESLPSLIVEIIYAFNMYLFITVLSDFFGSISSALFGIKLSPHFRQPYLSSSLEDFWARRWNITVSSNLKHTVYIPILQILSSRSNECKLDASSKVKLTEQEQEQDQDQEQKRKNCEFSTFGSNSQSMTGIQAKKLISEQFQKHSKMNLMAKSMAVISTFFVSGIMHELALFYMTYKITGELLLFFTLNGFATAMEAYLQIRFKKNMHFIPKFVSVACTLSFILLSAHYFFFPPFIRHGAEGMQKNIPNFKWGPIPGGSQNV